MGNVLDHESSGEGIEDADVIEEDLKWLAVKGSMMFNDDFLEEEYANLPQYDGTEIDSEPGDRGGNGDLSTNFNEMSQDTIEDSSAGCSMRNETTIRRMLQLLGPKGTSDGEVARGLETGQAARGTSVEDFPPLLTENYLRRSTHATAARMRARLFQRMHLAVLRQAYRSKTSQDQARGKDAGASTTLSAFALPPSASTKARLEEDPAAILTSASMRMSLTIMGALRVSCPGLFISVAQTLMDLFLTSAPFALGQVGSSSAYLETLSQVRQVAENAAATGADSPNDERQQAMALLLSLGLATGSISDVVSVARYLLERGASSLPPSAEPFLKRLKNQSMPTKTTIPRPNTWTASFPARLDTGDAKTGGSGSQSRSRTAKAAAGAAACNPATDGVYVYVWEASSKGIHKVGTGFHGTLAGNVYHCRKNIFDDIRAYKGMEPALPEEEEADDGEDHDAASREERITGSGAAVQSSERVVVSAANERRRLLLGTGLNIGGGAYSLGSSSGSSSSSSSDSDGNSGNDFISNFYFGNRQEDYGSAAAADVVAVSRPGMQILDRTPPNQPPRGVLTAATLLERMDTPIAAIAGGGEGSPVREGDDNGTDVASSYDISAPGVGSSSRVRLHRVPTPSTPPLIAVAAAVGLATAAEGRVGQASDGSYRFASPVTPARSRGGSPPGTMDGIFGVIDERLAERRDQLSRLGAEREEAGIRGGRPGLLRFRAVEDWYMVPEVPDSGRPSDVDEDDDSVAPLHEGDEGDVWSHKTVNGFRWYRVNVLRRPLGSAPLLPHTVGWVPIFPYDGMDDSEVGSMDSGLRADMQGCTVLTLMDPVTEEVIGPDSTRARAPPTWEGGDNTAGVAGDGRDIDNVGATDRPSDVFAAREGPAAIRPVWLALAGEKLFFREKASGALSAHEIAVLRPSDLSLESIISLADLPIPGFPRTSAEASATAGNGNAKKANCEEVTGDSGGNIPTASSLGVAEGKTGEEEEPEVLIEFADASVGAVVTGCSSNYDTSGGVLQKNLLVQDPLQRVPLPVGESTLHSSLDNVAFSFAPSDTDRVIVVDLGRSRRVREVGVELSPVAGVAFADAVGRLLIETSVSASGRSWVGMGQWNAADHVVTGGNVHEEARYYAEICTAGGSDHPARLIRFSLSLPAGSSSPEGSPTCLLRRLAVRGVEGGAPISPSLGEEEEQVAMPFPAMTTDSRHIVLVHARSQEGSKGASWGFGEEVQQQAGSAADTDVEKRLELFFLDPKDGYRLAKTVFIKWELKETHLHRHGLLCDGDRLVMLGPRQEGDLQRTADTKVVSLRCRCGSLEASAGGAGDEHRAEEKFGMLFEQQEDMDFDVRAMKLLAVSHATIQTLPQGARRACTARSWLCRWRVDGLSPTFPPPRPVPPTRQRNNTNEAASPTHYSLSSTLTTAGRAREDRLPVRGRKYGETCDTELLSTTQARFAWIRAMLASPCPAYRIEALEEAGREARIDDSGDDALLGWVMIPARDAALLLGYLERLGEPYGPPEEPAAESRARCELEAASGGSEDGNFARLLVRGEDFSCKEAGVNVLVLSESLDVGGEAAKSFALQESRHAANQLADYLNDVPVGRTVMIAVQDDAAGNLTNAAKRALSSVGAGHDEVNALAIRKRSSFALIGRKGATPGSVPQVLRSAGKGCARVRQRLPAPKVPMCVDVSKGSLHSLVTLILQHESVLLQSESVPIDRTRATPDARGRQGGLEGEDNSEIQRSLVLSAVNILTTQMFQLLRGATSAQALEAFSADHLARLLGILLAVIDRDQPLHSEQPQEQPSFHNTGATGTVDRESPRSQSHSAGATQGMAVPTSPGSKLPHSPSPTPEAGAGGNVRVVSCTGTSGGLARAGLGPTEVGGLSGTEEGRGWGGTKVLLQKACLRLFVTGMDLFYPSCEDRCSLLAQYLTKYLSDGLSPARQIVLELLLRRMSDPGQLVELMAHTSSLQPSSGLPDTPDSATNPFILPSTSIGDAITSHGRTMTSLGGSATAATDTSVRYASSLPAVLDVESPGGAEDVIVGGKTGRESPSERLTGSGSSAPSPMELQSLLLRVGTAEGIAQIKATGRQVGIEFDGGYLGGGTVDNAHGRGSGDGSSVPGGVGEAAVEMLGRLTNQLLSSAACIIMESDLGAFDNDLDSQELNAALQGEGMPPFPVSPRAAADSRCALPNVDVDVAGDAGGDDCGDAGVGCDGAVAVSTSVMRRATAANGKRPFRGDMSAASTLAVLVTTMCRSCAALAAQAVQTVDLTVAATDAAAGAPASKGTLPPEVDQILQESPLGALLPMLTSSLKLLVEKHGSKMQDRLSGMARELIGVMKWSSELLARVPQDRLVAESGGSRSVGSVTKTVMMESKHDYEPNTHQLEELHIAGASRMTITFDPRTRTEDGYDYVIFWKDEERSTSFHPGIPKFSGSGNSCNFPGFGGRPPLIIESDRVFVEWKTDQSNEDWGWRFIATAEVKKPSSGGDGGGYWLLGLDRQLAGAGAALAGCLVMSKPWGGKAEDDNAPWMEDDLLAGARDVSHAAAVAPSPKTAPNSTATPPSATSGDLSAPWLSDAATKAGTSRTVTAPGASGGSEMSGDLTQPRSPALPCLLEVVDRLPGTGGSALCKAMREKVGEDQGAVEAVNRAVYATCAALIWHQGIGSDVLALVEGRVKSPSKALTKAWRFGQQMRRYFDYGDVRDAVDSQMELQRQKAIAADPALLKSSSINSLDEPSSTSRPILTRGPSVYQGAEEKVIAEVSERIVSRALFLLTLPSHAGRKSSQDQSKRRWGLLSKLGKIGRSSSQAYFADGAELLERWMQVVDEATAMHKLKSILTYRRKAAEMRERANKDSVGERIMKFVQYPAAVAELEQVRKCRDQRAQLRAEGLRLMRALVSAAASRPSKAWLLASHAQSIRLTKRNERPGAHVHYLNSVEGCEPNAHLALVRQFALLVTSSLDILKECSRPRVGETDSQAAERQGLAVSALQALALDYDVGDHDILQGSILLEVLEPLLEGFDGQGTNYSVPGVDDLNEDPTPNACPPHTVSGEEEEEEEEDDDDDDDEKDDLEWEKAFMEELGPLGEEMKEGGGANSKHSRASEEKVRRAAWCLFEVLLPRCVGLEGQGLETRFEEPTGFSHRLLDVLVRQVGQAAANVQKSNESLCIGNSLSDVLGQASQGSAGLHTGDEDEGNRRAAENIPDVDVRGDESDIPSALTTTTPLPKETPLLKNGMRLRRDVPGRAAAHREIGVRYSMALWLWRDSCPMDAKSEEWYSTAKPGDTVARGPRWPLGNMMDGGLGGLGKVIGINKSEMTVMVQWDVTGQQDKFKMGAVAGLPAYSVENSAPASVDDLLVWEVVKVDPSVGGNVVMKGAANNLNAEERNSPWSSFGLSLQGNASLMYYGVSGEDQLFVLHSKHTLQPETWTHVAVVQTKSRCCIYIDGEEDAEAPIPSHMLNPGVGMPRSVIESQHPYADNTEQTWEARVDGAVSYTITFDPMTKTEANHDFVRFCETSDIASSHYGESRYSGGTEGSTSNWPGLAGRPPLVINAPSFWVHFRTDQSTFDWGFKLTYSACVTGPEGSDDDSDGASLADLNPFPVYLGQPPSYVSSQRSATGYVWGASTFSGAITAEQVRGLSMVSPPPPEPVLMEEEACTDVLSLVQRCASATDGAVSQGGGFSLEAGAGPLVSPQVLGPLLVLLLQGSLKLRLSAARLCEKLLPQAPPEMVQVQLRRVGLVPSAVPISLSHQGGGGAGDNAAPLVRALMLRLGEILSVWGKPTATAVLDKNKGVVGRGKQGVLGMCPPGNVSKEARATGEEAFALAGAHIGLLRALPTKDGWYGPLSDCLREACADLPRVVKALEEAALKEINNDDRGEIAKAVCDPSLWMAHACFALLGGSFQGLHVGGRALALLGDGDNATVERCTILALERPRPHYLKAMERQAAANGAVQHASEFAVPAEEWEGLQALGDAVIVCQHSEPEHPRTLPRGRVSPSDAPLPPAFLSALKTPPVAKLPSPLRGAPDNTPSTSSVGLPGVLDDGLSAEAHAAVLAAREKGTPGLVPFVPRGLIDVLVEAFGVLSSADTRDKRARHKPLVVVKEVERILESPHPHDRRVDETFPLNFPGAEHIELLFDDSCRTEAGGAYIRIYKDESQTAVWGESKYHGRDKYANWPGLDGRPHVRVPASRCVIKFHAGDGNPDWGYRIIARSTCKEFTNPPERPPLAGVSALSALQACGAKALLSLVTSWPQFVRDALPLIAPLARRGLCDNGGDFNSRRSAVAQTIVLESQHPYQHNADRREMVKIDGAKKLIVTFDERTRTEAGCDYVSIYTDETMTVGYGEAKYTGGKGGHPGNWPGMDGRPALIILASSFFFVWMTDGSVNDWGWKMTVAPVMGKVDPITLPAPMLDSRLASLLMICRDCPREQPPATGLEKFDVELEKPVRRSSPSKFLGVSTEGNGRESSALAKPPSMGWDLATSSLSAANRIGFLGHAAGLPARWATVRDKWPRVFVVNARDAEEVSLRAEPRRDSAEIGKLRVAMPILATDTKGDWLRVLPGPEHATPAAIDGARAQLAALPTAADVGTAEPAFGGVPRGNGAHFAAEWVQSFVSNMASRNPGEGAAEQEGGMAEATGETCRVAAEGVGNAGAVAWALRRQGDMLYMVPEEEAPSHLITLPDEGDQFDDDSEPDGRGASVATSRSGSTHPAVPAFQVVDPPVGAEDGPASQGAFGIQAGEELAADSGRLWSALAETSHATASRFSRLALTRILAGWAEGNGAPSTAFEGNASIPTFSLDAFGGQETFLSLLRTTFAEERESKNETDAAALEVLKKKILDVVEGDAEEGRKMADMLVSFSLHQFRAAAYLADFLCPTKAVVRTWETSHNYEDNTDSYTKICIPGAKRIRIVFDEKCSTEMGCDYVRIYKDGEHNSVWGEQKYHGPVSNRSRVWAGVDGRPPLMVEADHFEIYFHSDGSNNDWGVRLSAFGIMQEPSAEQRAALQAKRKELGRPETDMACWLLEALAKVTKKDYVRGIMYKQATFETLVRFLEAAESKDKIGVIHLLTAMLEDVSNNRTGGKEPVSSQEVSLVPGSVESVQDSSVTDAFVAALEVERLASSLTKLADTQAAMEKGRGAASRSPLLQALVQACVAADGCLQRGGGAKSAYGVRSPSVSPAGGTGQSLEGGSSAPSLRWTAKRSSQFPFCLETDRFCRTIAMTNEDSCSRGVFETTVLTLHGRSASTPGGSLFRWNMRIEASSGEGPSVGIGIGTPVSPEQAEGGEVDSVRWLLTWSCRGKLTLAFLGATPLSADFGPTIKVGDVITVEVDPIGKIVAFYRNQAFVGIALGPVGSGAALEHGKGSPAASVFASALATHNDVSKNDEPFVGGMVAHHDGCWASDAMLRGAVTLRETNDAVKLVPPPSIPLAPPLPLANQGEGASEGNWLGLVRETLELMSAVGKRELPRSFVAKNLLPKCQKQYAVRLESTHPLPAKPTERSVSIPGASALEVTFDRRTSMGLLDKISIFRDNSTKDPERMLVGLQGGTESRSASTSSHSIALGDRVVRGPSWDWGAGQDGGPGGLGTVVDVRTWKGQQRAGAKVLWDDTKFEGLYRWDYEGCFDLLVVGNGDESTKPIVVSGDVVNIKVDPEVLSRAPTLANDGGWSGTLQLKDRRYVSVKLPTGREGSVCMSKAFTLEAWFRLQSLDEDLVGSGSLPLLSRGIMAGLSQIDIRAVLSSDRTVAKVMVKMNAANQSMGILLEGGTLVPGTWGHVAFSIDGAGQAKLLVDGKEVAHGQFCGERMDIEDCELAVGMSFEIDQRLAAHVHDLRLWSRAVSASEIARGRKALPARGSQGLIANFPFDDGLREAPRNRGTSDDITAQLHGPCFFDVEVESPSPAPSSPWGWACTVTPIYTPETLHRLPELKEQLEGLRQVYCGVDARHDFALVRYVNSFAEKKQFDADHLLRCSWNDMMPSEEDLVREPLVRELSLCPPPASTRTKTPLPETSNSINTGNVRASRLRLSRGHSGDEKIEGVEMASPRSGSKVLEVDSGVEETKGEPVRLEGVGRDRKSYAAGGRAGGAGAWRANKEACISARFEVLLNLNKMLRDALPYFDPCQIDRQWSAAALLSRCRGLIFQAVKTPVLVSALTYTAYGDAGQFDLKLNRPRAARNIQAGRTDVEGRWSVFGQAFRQIHTMHPKILRTANKVYNCIFMGEHAQDSGGPYRESWSMYAQELQSTALPLLIRTPNGKHAAGMGRDNYVPNPGATSPAQVEMFIFLGKLMGHAIRSKEYIGLNLSGVVWKALVRQEVNNEDLEGVDVLLTKSMHDLRTIHQKGVTREMFSDIFMETFTALSLDDSEVELKPGGRSMPVTWDNRMEYADLVESHRLAECCSMVKHIRKGLSMVVPISVLGMFTGEEVECMVCGKPEVDVDLLEAVTEYSGCRKDQPHIKLFWQALREFTSEERSMLIKFTWGRTRLPLTAEGFSQRFKVQNFVGTPPDDYLPVAHTCFFSLELPEYSSLEVMKERLRNAIYNCQAIDGDDTLAGMQAATMGWDWEED